MNNQGQQLFANSKQYEAEFINERGLFYLHKWRNGEYANFGEYLSDMWCIFEKYITSSFIKHSSTSLRKEYIEDYLSECKMIFINALKSDLYDENSNVKITTYLYSYVKNKMKKQKEIINSNAKAHIVESWYSFNKFAKKYGEQSKIPLDQMIDEYNKTARPNTKISLNIYLMMKYKITNQSDKIVTTINGDEFDIFSIIPSQDISPEENYLARHYDNDVIKNFIIYSSEKLKNNLSFTFKQLFEGFVNCVKILKIDKSYVLSNNKDEIYKTVYEIFEEETKDSNFTKFRVISLAKSATNQLLSYSEHLGFEPKDICKKENLAKIENCEAFKTINKNKNSEFFNLTKNAGSFVMSSKLLDVFYNEEEGEKLRNYILTSMQMPSNEISVFSSYFVQDVKKLLKAKGINSGNRLREFIEQNVDVKTF